MAKGASKPKKEARKPKKDTKKPAAGKPVTSTLVKPKVG
jgi:hypothetical protein